MANIDNTILSEIMLSLSKLDYQRALWKEWWGDEGFGRGAKDTNTINRFFNGLSTNKSKGKRCWWPEKNRRSRFEKTIKQKFKMYADYYDCNIKKIFELIQNVCERYNVSSNKINEIKRKLEGSNPLDNTIDWIIKECKWEYEEHNDTQKNRSLNHTDLIEDEGHNEDLPLPLIEGAVLRKPHKGFLSWREPSNWEFTKDLSGAIIFNENDFFKLPYLELFGSGKRLAEFIEDKNLIIKQEVSVADIESRVTCLNYSEEVEAERKAASKLKYVNHPPKMYLERMEYLEDASEAGNGRLTLHIGSSDYLGQRVYRREMSKNPKEQHKFQEVLSGLRGKEYRLHDCPWASIGGGVWIIVRDERGKEYLILSLRNPKRVAEVGGVLGYSSSGSYDRKDKSPARAMAREIEEEIGIPQPGKEELKLISLGVDTERYLIQCSYLLETQYTIDFVQNVRKGGTESAGEQTNFFVPLDGDILKEFLRHCAFEPGAAYSLMRLIQKRGEW